MALYNNDNNNDTDNNDINIFLSMENPWTFLFAKRPENTFLTLIESYRKIVQ